MGEVELHTSERQLTLHADMVTYGNAADEVVTERMRAEIETMWNEPVAIVPIHKIPWRIQFRITASCIPNLDPLVVVSNTDPRKNFFRIEEKAVGNISFVDGLGSNTGYFQYDNLYEGSTTAAHEFGHTLGLDHPRELDIRGKGQPGIMYPRGTLVDPEFQYDPKVPPGVPGGTIHPRFRRVRLEDIRLLGLEKLRFTGNRAILGAFTNIYHSDHAGWANSIS